ncbi:MAG: carboxypeptidase regulatory-like domain-containing protein [Bryobacteraceae bacterium]
MSCNFRVLSALCLLSSGLLAQEFRATITGRVLDPSGAAVPNVAIRAVNAATNETSNATSDSSGAYTIPFLRPGAYKLTATAQGFKVVNRESVTLQVSQIAGIDITLEVGAVTDVVNVTGEAALLETQTASRSGIVNSLAVSELPLNARNPFMLGTMMSGVVFRGAAIWQRPFDNGAIAQWSVNGGRESNNEFMMDGAPNNGQAGGNNIAYVPIVDAVQEFNVQQNSYDAQYGKTGGGVFNVVLKSGTTAFHATGWEFLRRPFLDGNTFQGNAVPQAAGVKNKRADHVLDQYGFQLDGPVYLPKFLTKSSPVKLFYLGSFENYREKTPNPLTNSYPEPEMRTGDFSKLRNASGAPILIYDPNPMRTENGDPVRVPFANNIIPASRISPVAAAVTKYMPLPNSATPSNQQYATNNFRLPNYVNNDKFYNLILKFDWNFGDRHRAYFRHASNDRTEDRAVNGIDNLPGTDGQQPFQRINDAYVADWLWTATPTLVFNVRGSYNRFIEKGFGRANEGFDLTSLGLPASLVSRLPGPTYFGRWVNAGYATLGRYQGFNFTNNYNLFANVTKIQGSHNLKMGIDLRRIHYLQQNSGNILNFEGERSFTQRLFNQAEATAGDTYASFLLGAVSGNQNYPLYPFNRQWYFAPYLQDDWKVSRRLTMNLGFRWDYNGPPDEKWNRLNRGFDATLASPVGGSQLPNLKGGFQFAGVNGNSRIAANRDLNNFQGRIGAAFQLSDKTVLRGGYGLYYLNPNNDFLQTAGFATNTDIVRSLDGNRTVLPNLLSNPFPNGFATPSGSSLGAATFVGRNNNWFDPNFSTPKVHQFSVGVQRQVSQSASLEISYVGSRSVDVNNERNFNIPSLAFRKSCNPLEGGSVAFCDAQIPNPFQGIEAFRGTTHFSSATLRRYDLNRPFPQFSGDLQRRGINGSKFWYNSAQVNYNQRIAGGVMIVTNYTFSKTVERYGWTDPFADVQQQGLYFNDRPHFFKFTGIYELPFGRNKKFGASTSGFVNKLIGGWEVTSFYTNASGEPQAFDNTTNNLISLKDPKTPGGPFAGSPDWKANQIYGFNPCVARLQNDGTTIMQPFSVQRGCANDVNQAAWLMLPSYAPRAIPLRSGQIRKHRAFTLDSSIIKNTQITERLRIQFRAEAFNLFNHNYFGRDNFTNDPNNANFGSLFPAVVSNQNSFPRQVQLGIKAYW